MTLIRYEQKTAPVDDKVGHLWVADVEWKAADAHPNGVLDGYMSIFNTPDQIGDVVVPGAFKKTFADWRSSGRRMPLLADHDKSSGGVIGSVFNMREDGKGARVKADFSSTSKAQDIRTNMLEGHQSGMSFTYIPLRYDFGQKDGQEVRFLRELKVIEATTTPFPMHPDAVAGAKGGDPAAPTVPLSTKLGFDAFADIVGKALTFGDLGFRREVINLAVKRYHPEDEDAQSPAGGTDGTATGDTGEGTDGAPAGQTTTDLDPAAETPEQYAIRIAHPTGPPDEAPATPEGYASRVLQTAADKSDMDRLEAELSQAREEIASYAIGSGDR